MLTAVKASNILNLLCNAHTPRVVRHISRPPASKTLGQEPRYNPLGIEMLPDRLHRQVFGSEEDGIWHFEQPNRDNLTKCIQHLRRHDLLPKQLSEIDTVYEYHKHLSNSDQFEGDKSRKSQAEPNQVVIDIPKLKGKDINEHFVRLGEEYSDAYKKLACDIIKNASNIVDRMPKEWVRKPGWTRYEPTVSDQFNTTQVESPLEKALIFDVETCMNDIIEHAPTMAVALSDKAWYSWTSPRLFEDNISSEQLRLKAHDLIQFQSSQSEEKLIIGHNVGFDRSFLRDQYALKETKTKFLDTLSIHMCICGLTGLQRAVKLAHKRKMNDEGSVDPEDIEGSSWIEKSSLNNLADVYEFHCGQKLSKDERDVFISGTMSDVRENYQSLMTYCANDVKATYEVFKKLFSTFLDRFPHPITLAGMLEMSTMYLPVYVNNWSRYIDRSQSSFDEFERRLSSALQDLANDACSMTEEEYSKNVWMWDADRSVQTIKPNKSKLVAWQKSKNCSDNEKDNLEKLVQDIYDTNAFMRRISPFLPGFPKWYRDLCCPISKAHALLDGKEWQPGPCLITTQMRVTPKLMRLTWNGYPLHHHQKYGWGYLVPNGDLLAEYGNIPEDHPYKNFPIEELRKLCKGLPKTPILVEDEEELREDLLQAKIDELKENTQLSSPNLIRMLKKFSKKKKVSARFRSEYCEDVDIPGAYFIRLPHKNGSNFNVGNPLGKDFIAKMEDGTLSSLDNSLANLLLRQSLSLSYWKNNQKRIRGQMVVALDDSLDLGAILPRVIVAGTVTRRAVEPTWLTASNQDTTRVGSELKAMIQSPPGYCFVGADVDSQELWIASLMGDSYSYRIHGGTGLSYMTLRGSKSEKTDMHSKTASLIGITRDDAKVLNYARIYGAGQKFIERFLMNTNPNLNAEQAKEKARTIFKQTKGERKFKSRIYWDGGTESATFNKLEEIASSAEPRTPVLGCKISQALEPDQDRAKDFVTSRVNWVVQSSAVDFLHLLLVNMKWLFKRLQIDGRFSISIHDEVRYLVKEEDKYKAAFALQVSNLLVRSYFAYKLNMRDLPISVAFFSSVDIDKCLRKEVNMDCKSPSNPRGLEESYGIPYGESLDIKETLRKYSGSAGNSS
jgi:DNA polymerase gamma 1